MSKQNFDLCHLPLLASPVCSHHSFLFKLMAPPSLLFWCFLLAVNPHPCYQPTWQHYSQNVSWVWPHVTIFSTSTIVQDSSLFCLDRYIRNGLLFLAVSVLFPTIHYSHFEDLYFNSLDYFILTILLKWEKIPEFLKILLWSGLFECFLSMSKPWPTFISILRPLL